MPLTKPNAPPRLSPAELLIRKNLHGALSETTLACDATDLHEVDHLADRHSNLEQVSEDKKSPPVQHGTTRYHMIQHGQRQFNRGRNFRVTDF